MQYPKRTERYGALASIRLLLLVVLCGPNHLVAQQQSQSGSASLHLNPGESISGAEHPEYFHKGVAFHSLLEVLAINPEDALHLQRRARTIEKKLIGLSDQDASELELIVEIFRTQELTVNANARALRTSGQSNVHDLLEIQHSRNRLVSLAGKQMRSKLSTTGNAQVDLYVKRIISQSRIINSTTAAK